MRHTKIIATIGPASDSDAVLDALIAAGTDIARLNFSHGTHESHAATYQRVRQAAARAGREVAILQDLSGPKIRTGALDGGRPLTLAPGDPLTIATGDFVGGRGRISTTFDGLARGVSRGDRLLLSDGTIELRVDDVRGRGDSDDGGRRRLARRAQRDQRAWGFAPGICDHAEGCRRSEVRPGARRRYRRGELRADGGGCHVRARAHRRSRRR